MAAGPQIGKLLCSAAGSVFPPLFARHVRLQSALIYIELDGAIRGRNLTTFSLVIQDSG